MKDKQFFISPLCRKCNSARYKNDIRYKICI